MNKKIEYDIEFFEYYLLNTLRFILFSGFNCRIEKVPDNKVIRYGNEILYKYISIFGGWEWDWNEDGIKKDIIDNEFYCVINVEEKYIIIDILATFFQNSIKISFENVGGDK